MSAYTCPDCGGSFPAPVKWQAGLHCPWCYEELLRHHNQPEQSLKKALETQLEVPRVSITRKNDDDGQPTLLQKLAGKGQQ